MEIVMAYAQPDSPFIHFFLLDAMPNYIGKREAEALKKWVDPITDDREKTVLYSTIIQPAFRKLVDNLIYKYGQTTNESVKELREECISHLVLKIGKFDYTRGSNPFSFFNVVAKHFIIHSIDSRKRFVRINQGAGTFSRTDKSESSGGLDEGVVSQAISNEQFVDNSYLAAGENTDNDFIQYIQQHVAKLLVRCEDKKEKMFLKHIIQILENNKGIDLSNKKQFYLMMRNMSNLNAREITKYKFNLVQHYYDHIKKTYYNEII